MTIVINGTTGISGVDGSAATPAVQGADTNTGVFYPAADTVGVSTGGTERMRVDSSGNVGIGTNSNPGTPVAGRLSVLPASNITTVATSTTLTLGEPTNNSAYQLRMAYSYLSSVYTGVIDAVQNSLGAPLAINPTGGNVGIGTSSPSYKLDVRSTFAVLDGSSNIGFYANGTTYTQIWQTLQSVNDFIIQTAASKYMSFGTNSTERMRITSNGGVSFGSSGTAYGSSGQVLQSNGDTAPTWVAGPLGLGQTWSVVTGSRAIGTTYTNSTGKTIFIAVSGYVSTGAQLITLTVSGSTAFQYYTAVGTNARSPLFAPIPAGATYVVSGFNVLEYWSELR